jgi:hypothetical protein
MATLKEIFGDKTRGDGRKVRAGDWAGGEWFEPIFFAKGDEWYGLDERGVQLGFPDGDEYDDFELVKITKKIKFYSPLIGCDGFYHAKAEWHMDKKHWDHIPSRDIKGWLEMEAEVEE